MLEGSGSSLDEVRDGAGDEVAADAVRVSAHVLSLVPVLRTAPLQAFARLHALASGAPDSGRPREAEAVARLQALGRLLTGPTPRPALLVAAVVHADLATAAPFPSHNGIVARAAERLVRVAAASTSARSWCRRPATSRSGRRTSRTSGLPRRWTGRGTRLAAVRRGGGRPGRRGEPARWT